VTGPAETGPAETGTAETGPCQSRGVPIVPAPRSAESFAVQRFAKRGSVTQLTDFKRLREWFPTAISEIFFRKYLPAISARYFSPIFQPDISARYSRPQTFFAQGRFRPVPEKGFRIKPISISARFEMMGRKNLSTDEAGYVYLIRNQLK
jgi:hypothetical protein